MKPKSRCYLSLNKPGCLWLLLFVFGCGLAQAAPPQDFSGLLKKLDIVQSRHNIPAYAVVISDDNNILLNDVRGVALAGSEKPVSPQGYFRIGSITKTFVALAALVAERQGKLKLTDKVTNTLGVELFHNPYQKTNPITIAQLLEHSAGFADMGRAEFASNDPVTLAQGLKRFAKGRRSLWPAGQFHSYSNTSYGLAGRVLEVATKTSINDWLGKAVFKPLGMTTATLLQTKTVNDHLVPGYQADGIEAIPYWHMIYPSLGAINLQPQDMAKLIQLYLKGGVGHLSGSLLQRQQKPTTTLAAKQGLEYGYGLGLYQWYRQGQLFYGHGGDADGYLSRFGFQKKAGLGYFFVINTFNNQAKSIMQRIIENFISAKLEPQTASKTVGDVDLSALAGDYDVATQRFKRTDRSAALTLKWSKGQLYIKDSDDQWDVLLHTGNGLFRRTFEPEATTAIFTANGKTWFSGDEGHFIKRQSEQ